MSEHIQNKPQQLNQGSLQNTTSQPQIQSTQEKVIQPELNTQKIQEPIVEDQNQNKNQSSVSVKNGQGDDNKVEEGVDKNEDQNNQDHTPQSNSEINNENNLLQKIEQNENNNIQEQGAGLLNSSTINQNQSQNIIPKEQEEIENPSAAVLEQQIKGLSRSSKKSQSSQSRPISHENNIQEIDQQQNQQPQKPVNYDQIESVIIKKNEADEVIKKTVQVIKIIRSSKVKPFLGGYRHATTQIVYHNGFSQTDQNRTQHKLQFTREVQTYDYSSKSSKVPRQFGTQMQKQGLYVDIRTDKVVYPRIYFDSDMWLDRRTEAALYIQRLTRGMFARKQTNQLKQQKYTKQMDKLNKQQEVRKKEQIKHKKQIQRRRNPRTKQDFQILYEELQNWRMAQIEKIKSNTSLTTEMRRKALKQTLDKQTDLLQTIDRLKIIAAKQNKEQKIQKFLKAMSDPKKWTRKSDGRVTEVHTPFTVRAKQLMDLYKGLKMKGVSTDERLDILLATKWTVKEWDCNLTRQIVELIDRQGSILDRGRPQSSLEGLRQRLANLFLQFIQYPLFNPEAARFQKIPYEIAEVGQQFH